MLLSNSPSTAATATRRLPPLARSRPTRLPPPCARVSSNDDARAAAAAAAEALLQSGLPAESLPRHVAVTMDGNQRWARARGLPMADGLEAGRRAMEQTVWLSHAWGIRALTTFAIGYDNLTRPKVEVDYLMGLLERIIRDNVAEFSEGIRVHVIGESSRQPASLRSAAREAEEATRGNSRLHLMIGICYSGRQDIVQACRALATKVQGDLLRPEDIDEPLLAGELQNALAGEASDPDLIIRTSGEQRMSNIMLWQSAYSELFFTDTLWPDFGEAEYLRALGSFHRRERRFGQRKF
ncbi:hypothetical protein ACP70R_011437 [Stipagrostis hirtigluma subsp. patula]